MRTKVDAQPHAEGFLIIDPEFRYLYLNWAVMRHSPTDGESLIGRTMMECYQGIEKTNMFRAPKT